VEDGQSLRNWTCKHSNQLHTLEFEGNQADGVAAQRSLFSLLLLTLQLSIVRSPLKASLGVGTVLNDFNNGEQNGTSNSVSL